MTSFTARDSWNPLHKRLKKYNLPVACPPRPWSFTSTEPLSPFIFFVKCLKCQLEGPEHGHLPYGKQQADAIRIRAHLPLSEWVSKCLVAMTPANKEAASAELKQVIASAYAKNELWTTNWSTKELERSIYRSDLKRKPDP